MTLADSGGRQAAEIAALALADEELIVRRAAVRALGQMRTADGALAGFEHLARFVDAGGDHGLRVAAIHALGESRDPRAAAVLGPWADASDPQVAVAAVEALGHLGDLDAVAQRLQHGHGEVVKAALGALVERRDSRSVELAARCLDHPAWDVRRYAADLLGGLGGASALTRLRARLAEEAEPLVRDALQRALLGMDSRTAHQRHTPAPGLGSWPPR